MSSTKTSTRTSKAEIETVEQTALEIASGGVAAKSTSIDGVSTSQTLQDPEKLVRTADALDKRRAAKSGPLSQMKLVKIRDF